MESRQFGWWKPETRDWKFYIKHINRWFVVLAFFAFSCFAFYNNVTKIVFADNKGDLFENNLENIASYFMWWDQKTANLIMSINDVKKGYEKDQDYFIRDNKGNMQYILQYLSNNPEQLKQLGLHEYAGIIDLISELSKYSSDIFSLLGEEETQRYLVVLQNGAEKRPNGGFFGSFAIVTVKDAKISNIQLMDSYYPNKVDPSATLQAPTWATDTFLDGQSEITFLASNKFGFTDIDGKNIKTLYEKVFHQKVRGVVFVNSEAFADLIPGFDKKLREWMFTNAATDIIRGGNLPNKKEFYMRQVAEILNSQKDTIIKNMVKNIDYLIENNYFHVYLDEIGGGLTKSLVTQGLTTSFRDDQIYFWDYNNSYNKIDMFITKHITFTDLAGKTILSTTHDIVNIKDILPGKYNVTISYALNIPPSYPQEIADLEKKYDIELTLREKTILGLYPVWSTRGVVYTPKHVSISSLNGQMKSGELFDTPFSHNALYVMQNGTDNSIKTVNMIIDIQ